MEHTIGSGACHAKALFANSYCHVVVVVVVVQSIIHILYRVSIDLVSGHINIDIRLIKSPLSTWFHKDKRDMTY